MPWISGYTRADGTKVRGHYRSNPTEIGAGATALIAVIAAVFFFTTRGDDKPEVRLEPSPSASPSATITELPKIRIP
ncbi:hypothetical protein [Actinocorallia longicatena]|uniref:Uncharacterized protein n=1 Tax=Actinocorallia longicatena TaxID=111803 RepID=A0ABP6QKM7_9ACTN